MAGHLGVQTLGDPATPRALDDEELFVVEGSKNSTSGACGQLRNLQHTRGARRKNVRFSMRNCSSATEAPTVHTSPENEGRAGCRIDFRICVPPSRRNCVKFAQKSSQVDAEYVSTVEPSIREQSRPRHLSLHNNGHVNTIPRNWTCGTPRSSAQCALCSTSPPICRGTG